MGHSDPSCETPIEVVVPDVFSGRSRPAASKLAHVWASVSPTAATPGNYIIPFVEGSQLFRKCHVAGEPGNWQITTTAVEYQRDSNEGPALLPLPDTAITQIPAGLNPVRRTQIQLFVTASDGAGIRKFYMDCNQSLSITAQECCVHWFWPPNSVDVQGLLPPPRDALTRTGLVVDAFIDAGVSRIESAPGSNSTCTFTTHLSVAAGQVGVTEIPPYAQAVTIYQALALGSASVVWTQHYGDPTTGSIEVGAFPFIVGQRRTQQAGFLGNVTHLVTDVDPDNARLFTLVWLIRP